MIRTHWVKEVLKEVTEDNDNVLTFLIEEQNKLPMIPYETLEMIQDANGGSVPLLRLFRCLETEKANLASPIEALDVRLIIIFEGVAYLKHASGKGLFLARLPHNDQLERNAHYLILLEHADLPKADLLEKVQTILREEAITYQEEAIDDPLFNIPFPWKVEHIFKTNLTITEKI